MSKKFPRPKSHVQNSHAQNHNQKFPCPKSHVQKFPMTKNHATQKKSMSHKKSMPHQNFTTNKIFHMSIHNYQIFPITIHNKKFPHDHVHVQLWKYHIHKKKFLYPQNFAINYTCQQIFHIHHNFVQPTYTTNSSQFWCPPKFKPKFIQQTSQITNIAKILHNFNAPEIQDKTHPTTSQITNIAKIP